MNETVPRLCGDCAALPGEPHDDGCDVANCLVTGIQRLQCFSGVHDCGRQVWSGAWPGKAECFEYGWHSFFEMPGRGWVRCEADDPRAGTDLNRLHMETDWDRQACRRRRFGDPVDDTFYVHWHLERGFALESSALYTLEGVTLPAAELLARIGRAS